MKVGAQQYAVGNGIRCRATVRPEMRGLQGVGYIAPGDGASTAVRGQKPGPECRLPLSSRDLCEHSDTGVVVTIGNLFLTGVGPGQALSLGFWISW